jgi:hypothetical protein
LRALTGLKEIRAFLERRPSPIDFKIRTEERLLGNPGQCGGDLLLIRRRWRANIQHVHLDLRLGRLLRDGQLCQANAEDYQDLSEHDGILNEDHENLKSQSAARGEPAKEM